MRYSACLQLFFLAAGFSFSAVSSASSARPSVSIVPTFLLLLLRMRDNADVTLQRFVDDVSDGDAELRLPARDRESEDVAPRGVEGLNQVTKGEAAENGRKEEGKIVDSHSGRVRRRIHRRCLRESETDRSKS